MGSVKRKTAARAKSADSERPAAAVLQGRVARRLRDERRKQGLRLGAVADALRIRKCYITAIENERYAELPGPTYALGFVSSYAHLLDLDRGAIVAKFREEIADENTRSELKFLVPLKEGRFPGRAVLTASLVLAVAVYVGWYVYTGSGANTPVAGAGPSAGQLAKVKPGGDGKPKAAAAKAGAEAMPRHLRAAVRTKQNAAVPGQPISRPKSNTISRAAAGQRAKARKAKPIKPAAAAVPASGKARIVLKALQDTWVQIQMADGTIVLSRLLKAGDTYAVLKNRGFVLTAGNAGGLRIIVDGRVLPALGPKGTVRRGIRLDADALLASR